MRIKWFTSPPKAEFTAPRAVLENGTITVWFPGSTVGISVQDTPEARAAIDAEWTVAVDRFRDACFNSFHRSR